MALTNSIVLFLGLALLTVPIVLHFLMQPKPKLATFPAIRFLREQQLASRRKMQIRHWVLLALRALIVLLLALALAGPAVAELAYQSWLGAGGFGLLGLLGLLLFAMTRVRHNASRLLTRSLLILAALSFGIAAFLAYQASDNSSGVSLGATTEPVTALIIVDNSPRMTYVRENISHFDRAQEMAQWVLSQLPADSQIAIQDLGNTAPFYSIDLAAAQKRIETMEVDYLSVTVPEAFRRGFEFLQTAEFERREIYILSDLTQTGWTSGIEMAQKLQAAPNYSVFIIDVGTDRPVNLAINDLKLDADRLTSATALGLSATLSSSGIEEQRIVQLSVEKPDPRLPVIEDGQTKVPSEFWIQTQPVTIPAQGQVNVFLQLGQSLPEGTHHGTLSILGGDGLEIDNNRYFSVEVGESWKVLSVSPPNVDPRILLGVMQSSAVARAGRSPFSITETVPEKLADFNLSQYQSIYLLDPTPLDELAWKSLLEFVLQGGGLGIFLGNNSRRGGAIDSSFDSATARELIGGEITHLFERPFDIENPDAPLWYISPQSLAHPLFQTIRRTESSFPWHQYPVYRHWGLLLEEQPKHPTQILLEYSNREPALVERSLGAGRVITMTTPITEPRSEQNWNRLIYGPGVGYESWAMFTILKHLADYLAQVQADTLNVKAGQMALLKNDPRRFPETYSLFTPVLTRSPTKVQASDDQIRYRFSDVPGHYRLKGSKDERAVQRGFSSNLLPAVTDLTRIDRARLDLLFGENRYQLGSQKIDIARQQGTSRKGQEFYPLLMLMLCIVFAMEYLMSNRFYNRPTSSMSHSMLDLFRLGRLKRGGSS